MIFDSVFNSFRGIIAYFRVFNGFIKKDEIIKTVSTNHNIELTTLAEAEAANYAKSFPNSNEWFKGKEVDKLSKEDGVVKDPKLIQFYYSRGVYGESWSKEFGGVNSSSWPIGIRTDDVGFRLIRTPALPSEK